jgi:hypothetical protein
MVMLGKLVTGFLPWNQGSHVEFVEGKVATRQIYLSILHFLSLPIIIPPMLDTYI